MSASGEPKPSSTPPLIGPAAPDGLPYGLYVPNAPNLIAPELFDGSGLATVNTLRSLDLEERVRPDAIIVISPHFIGRHGFLVQVSERPKCLHDFGGFDPRLYDAVYEPPGDPGLGRQLVEAGQIAGLPVQATETHGLDHGAWAPLLHLAPHQRIPVVPTSVASLEPEVALNWGRAIAGVAHRTGRRIAIVATGSILHRLDRFDPDSSERWEEGALLEQELVELVLTGHVDAVTHFDRSKWKQLAPEGELVPLFVLLGAVGPGYRARMVSTEQAFGAVGLSVLEFAPAPT